jgi:hypothetical protein
MFAGLAVIAGTVFIAGCEPQPMSNANLVHVNANSGNAVNTSNSNVNSMLTPGSVVDAAEPVQYQANIKLTFEALGEKGKTTMPAVGARVLRSGDNRALEFALPNGEKVIYLETGSSNFVVLPARKQYAELSEDALGFEVRRLMMPKEIVAQMKAIPGVRLVGDENLNGRTVTKYAYNAAADTQTDAGKVSTESTLLVDKETGLPLRAELASQSASGTVQGYKGLRILTEMTDINPTPEASLLEVPPGFAKIDPETVKAQANLIFSAAAAIIGQMVTSGSSPSPSASPVR